MFIVCREGAFIRLASRFIGTVYLLCSYFFTCHTKEGQDQAGKQETERTTIKKASSSLEIQIASQCPVFPVFGKSVLYCPLF